MGQAGDSSERNTAEGRFNNVMNFPTNCKLCGETLLISTDFGKVVITSHICVYLGLTLFPRWLLHVNWQTGETCMMLHRWYHDEPNIYIVT